MIDRNEYIRMCQKVAMLPRGAEIPEELRLVFRGIEWYPIYYAMKFDSEGDAVNVACLRDLNANCTDYAILTEIERKAKK